MTDQLLMGNIVNLRKARKEAARAGQEKRAVENRIAHGRSKAERILAQARREKTEQVIDQHLLNPDDRK